MTRAAAVVAAILVLPGIAPAQEEGQPADSAQQADSLHTVERGESLWWLARRYYDDPFDWRRIYEANQGAIDDPNWIYPGQHFEIPGVTTGRVTGVEVAGGRGGGEEGAAEVSGVYPGPDDRTVFADPPRDDVSAPDGRTAFYPREEDQIGGGVLGAERVEYLAVSRDVFYGAEWVLPRDEAQFPGRVAAWAGREAAAERRTTAFPFDRLRIEWHGDELPAQGDLLQALRIARDQGELGHVLRPSGILRVVRRVEGGVIAVSLTEFNRLSIEDFVVPAPAFPLEPGQYAQVVDGGTEARIIGFAQPREVQQVGDVAFLNVGAADGVAVGDVFELRTSSGGGWSGEVAGKLQVIRVLEDRSSARISRLVSPVFRPGLRVRMAAKMP